MTYSIENGKAYGYDAHTKTKREVTGIKHGALTFGAAQQINEIPRISYSLRTIKAHMVAKDLNHKSNGQEPLL